MSNLNNEQNRAVKHLNGPMLVLAGPGSGKTHTLVERIRYMIEAKGIPPSKILVITFSKKACVEMTERFVRLTGEKHYPVTFGTFHSIFYNILRSYRNYTTDSILTPKLKIEYMKNAIKRLNEDIIVSSSFISDALSKISLIKSMDGSLDEKIEKVCEEVETRDSFKRLYMLYANECKINDKLDFDDMLIMCRDLLKNNANIRLYWQSIFEFFLVDEFQDINDIQYEVLGYLAGEKRNIFAVGDDDQSIYGFRGSKPEIMKEFSESENCAVVDMYKNYRCGTDIIAAAGCLIANNSTRIVKNQLGMVEETGEVYYRVFEDENSEMDFVAATLNSLASTNGNIKDTAIIFRTERSGDLAEEILQKAAIKYNRNKQIASFYDSDWMQDIYSYLKLAAGEYERSLVYRVLNKPDRHISREVVPTEYNEFMLSKDVELCKLNDGFIRMGKMNGFGAINYILKGLKYEDYIIFDCRRKKINDDERNEFIEGVISRSKRFKTVKEWVRFIEDLDNVTADKKTVDGGGLTLLTAHASKGLEFDTVFIVDLIEGNFPHGKSHTDIEVEEERRLMYVAMTRAKKRLYLLGRGADKYGKQPSRFIREAVSCGKVIEII